MSSKISQILQILYLYSSSEGRPVAGIRGEWGRQTLVIRAGLMADKGSVVKAASGLVVLRPKEGMGGAETGETMNSRQRMVLWVGLLVIVAMGIYPPWIFRYGDIRLGRRYALITEPPSYGDFPGPLATLDANQLGIEWGAVVVISASLMYIWRDHKKPSGRGQSRWSDMPTHWRTT